MGRRLGIDVTTAAECLACHASPQQVPTAGGEFGVSCEACHGASSGWYGGHFQRGFDRAAAVANHGMVDTKDPAVLAGKCLECHLGDATRVVDHRLIAAGHPELRFELGSYLLAMGPRWRQRGEESRDWFLRAALAGPLVAVERQLRNVAREAGGERATTAIDWSNRDCAACHHDLGDVGWQRVCDWRLDHGMAVPVGQAQLDTSRFPAALAAAVGGVGDVAALAKAAIAELAGVADAVAGGGLPAAEHAAQLLHSLQAAFALQSWALETSGAAADVRARLLALLDSAREFAPADFAFALRSLTR